MRRSNTLRARVAVTLLTVVSSGAAHHVAARADALSVRSKRVCNDPTPAATMDELAAAIYGCWTPPEGSTGMGVTLQFMLLRDGGLKGKVIVAWVKPLEASPAREEFFNKAIEAVKRASPVPLREAMKETVPGRVFRLTFHGEGIQ